MKLTITYIKSALAALDNMEIPCQETAYDALGATDEDLRQMILETQKEAAEEGAFGYRPWLRMFEDIVDFRANFPEMIEAACSYVITDMSKTDKVDFVNEVTFPTLFLS